jgi:uncharacterized membrane protein
VNEKVYSDIAFVVDSKTVRAHKAIVQARCPNMFKKAVKKVSSKKGLTVYEIDEKSKITEDALTRILIYLYSGQVDFANLELLHCIHLILAGCIYELERLVQMCERYTNNTLILNSSSLPLSLYVLVFDTLVQSLQLSPRASHFG